LQKDITNIISKFIDNIEQSEHNATMFQGDLTKNTIIAHNCNISKLRWLVTNAF